MPLHVSTVGIEVPDDFPQKPYDAVHSRVMRSPRNDESIFHYGGAWNAVVYRFVSCARSSERFAESVQTVGSSPDYPARFIQEVALFGFFVDGLSVMETFFYGLYWIGSMIDSASFPVLTGDDKRLRDIQLRKTVGLYIARFGTCPLTDAFGRLGYRDSSGKWRNTSQYEEWNDVRNILAHRAAYGRAFAAGRSHEEAVWRVRDIPLTDQLTSKRRQWLASTLAELMNGAEILVSSNL